jgi:hypothetical protein
VKWLGNEEIVQVTPRQVRSSTREISRTQLIEVLRPPHSSRSMWEQQFPSEQTVRAIESEVEAAKARANVNPWAQQDLGK